MSKSIVEIEGFTELLAKIKQLPDKVKRREMLKVLRQSSKATVRAARANAPVSKKQHVISGATRARRVIQPGNLKKAIGNRTGKDKGKAIIYVGARKTKKFDAYYSAIVIRGARRANNNPSGFKGNPFIDRAYNSTKGQVTADTEKNVARYIQKQIDKLSNA